MTLSIDGFSARILSELQSDGRLSVQDLSEKIGLSSTPTWRRLKALEQEGVIRRYSAELDRRAVGLRNCILAEVNLERHGERVVEDFEAAVNACEHIVDCFSTTGQADYLLRVLTPDMESYDDFLHRVIFKLPGVKGIRSSVVLREVKSNAPLPLQHLIST